MKVLVVSEGIHELGDQDTPGALAVLVRRLTNAVLEIETRSMSDPRLHTHSGRGHGFEKRAMAWMLQAEREGFEAVVIVIDEDGFPDRAPAFSRAQSTDVCSIPRATGVAVRTFDAWMLADSAVLARTLGRVIDTQPEPETIKDPKNRFKSLSQIKGLRDVYRQIAEVINLGILAKRCPKGFGVFASRVHSLGDHTKTGNK